MFTPTGKKPSMRRDGLDNIEHGNVSLDRLSLWEKKISVKARAFNRDIIRSLPGLDAADFAEAIRHTGHTNFGGTVKVVGKP